MYLKVHLSEEGSSWSWDVAMRITFRSKDRGEWALVDNKYVNLMAYERSGEFRLVFVGDVPKMECYDGIGTKGPAFTIYFAPVSDADRRPNAERGTTWPMEIENPRNPAGIDCNAEWSILSGPVLTK